MYGIVNKSIKEYVTTADGASTWETIRKQAGVDLDVFISNKPYPDEISYRLVSAAVDILGVSSRDFLIGLGEHWIINTGQNHYGPLLAAGGESFADFLVNLNQFHLRVRLIHPELNPPDFICTDVEPDRLKLHYRTHRPGLSDFVVGLLQGLGTLFNDDVFVELIESKNQGADHDVFDVRWAPKISGATR